MSPGANTFGANFASVHRQRGAALTIENGSLPPLRITNRWFTMLSVSKTFPKLCSRPFSHWISDWAVAVLIPADINISASILGADELRTEAYNIRIVVTT